MLRRFFPLNMTAAGTVQPAKVVVLGAGVAGLQAIATAKRLGAVVSGVRRPRGRRRGDPRRWAPRRSTSSWRRSRAPGGYAREMTEDRAARQRELLAPYIAAADALITTAAVPGRQAPLLVTRAMVEQMRPGSVVVDLAAETGGNVEGSVAGEVVRIGNAQVWGGRNVPSQMPGPASRLYAQNIVNLRDPDDRAPTTRAPAAFAPDFEDEIVAGACVTHDGAIRHEPTRERAARRDPSRRSRRPRSERDRLADDLRAQRLRRHRGDLEGLLDAAHAADVGRQRHPRRHPARRDHRDRATPTGVALVVGLVAIVLAAVNMVGGFVVTDRMLQMFTRRKKPTAKSGRRQTDEAAA